MYVSKFIFTFRLRYVQYFKSLHSFTLFEWLCPSIDILARGPSELIFVHVQDFARLPWQNQPSQSASTLAGPLSGSSIPMSAPYASGQANGSAFNGGHSQTILGNGGLHQVTELGVDDLDLRAQTSLRLGLSFSDFQRYPISLYLYECVS
jgi:hypothetical protein